MPQAAREAAAEGHLGGGPAGPDAERRRPERRCIVTGAVRPKDELVRFVLGPDGEVVPDVAGTLPGRGLWLTARRDIVDAACAKGLFAKAARRPARAPADLADRVEALLARRCLDLLGLARRSGQVAAGFEKVRAWVRAGRAAILLTAADGASTGRDRIRALAPDMPLVGMFSGEDLGSPLGRDRLVHVAVAPGRIAERLLREAARLAGFRARGDGATDEARRD